MSAAGQMRRREPVTLSTRVRAVGVAEYKLYCLDHGGRISQRHDFEAADDKAAIALARAQHPNMTCELWCSTRKVALLPAGGVPVYSRSMA